MKSENTLDERLKDKCYLTFPTERGTAHVLTKLAHIQGITQAELLAKICHEYINTELGKFLKYAKDTDLDITKYIENKTQQS